MVDYFLDFLATDASNDFASERRFKQFNTRSILLLKSLWSPFSLKILLDTSRALFLWMYWYVNCIYHQNMTRNDFSSMLRHTFSFGEMPKDYHILTGSRETSMVTSM